MRPMRFFHLARRLVGKGERENRKCVDALVNEVGNSVGKHTGLSRTCSCDHHHGSFYMSCSGPLRLVQTVQHLHFPNVAGLGSNTLPLMHPKK